MAACKRGCLATSGCVAFQLSASGDGACTYFKDGKYAGDESPAALCFTRDYVQAPTFAALPGCWRHTAEQPAMDSPRVALSADVQPEHRAQECAALAVQSGSACFGLEMGPLDQAFCYHADEAGCTQYQQHGAPCEVIDVHIGGGGGSVEGKLKNVDGMGVTSCRADGGNRWVRLYSGHHTHANDRFIITYEQAGDNVRAVRVDANDDPVSSAWGVNLHVACCGALATQCLDQDTIGMFGGMKVYTISSFDHDYGPTAVLDGRLSSFWFQSGSSERPPFLQFDFQRAALVSSYALTTRAHDCPTTWRLEGSANGSPPHVRVASETGQVCHDKRAQAYRVASPGLYRYLLLVIEAPVAAVAISNVVFNPEQVAPGAANTVALPNDCVPSVAMLTVGASATMVMTVALSGVYHCDDTPRNADRGVADGEVPPTYSVVVGQDIVVVSRADAPSLGWTEELQLQCFTCAGGDVQAPTNVFVQNDHHTPQVSSVSPASGVGGDIITLSFDASRAAIDGSSLSGDAGPVVIEPPTVSIAGLDCPVVDGSVTSHSLQCTVPAHAGGTFTVRVLTAFGLGYTASELAGAAADSFTFEVALTSVAPALGSVCGGQLITLTGNGFADNVRDMTVLVGGQPCEVRTTSMSEIVCETPPHLNATNLTGTDTAVAAIAVGIDSFGELEVLQSGQEMDARWICSDTTAVAQSRAVNCLTGGFDPHLAAVLVSQKGFGDGVCGQQCAYEFAGRTLREAGGIVTQQHWDEEIFLDSADVAAWLAPAGSVTAKGSRSGVAPRFRTPYPLPTGSGGWRLQNERYAGLWLDVASNFLSDATGGPAPTCETATCPERLGGGQAMEFFSGDALVLGTAAAVGIKQKSFTVTMWLRLDDALTGPLLGTAAHDAAGNQLFLGLMATGEAQTSARLAASFLGIERGGCYSDTALVAGQWHHVAFRYNYGAQEQDFVVDGEPSSVCEGVLGFGGEDAIIFGDQQQRGSAAVPAAVHDLRVYGGLYMDDMSVKWLSQREGKVRAWSWQDGEGCWAPASTHCLGSDGVSMAQLRGNVPLAATFADAYTYDAASDADASTSLNRFNGTTAGGTTLQIEGSDLRHRLGRHGAIRQHRRRAVRHGAVAGGRVPPPQPLRVGRHPARAGQGRHGGGLQQDGEQRDAHHVHHQRLRLRRATRPQPTPVDVIVAGLGRARNAARHGVHVHGPVELEAPRGAATSRRAPATRWS